MKKLLLWLLLVVPTLAQNYVTVTAANIQNGGAALLPAGTISFQAVGTKQQAISYQTGGGGQQILFPTICTVVNGAITGTCSVANVLLTQPQNICFSVTIKNASGQVVLGGTNSGYQCVQPTTNNLWCVAGVCNFDAYVPNTPSTLLTINMPFPQTNSLGGIYSQPCSAGSVVSGYSNLGVPICVSSGSGSVLPSTVNQVATYHSPGAVQGSLRLTDNGTTFGVNEALNAVGGISTGGGGVPGFSGIVFPCISNPGTPGSNYLNLYCDANAGSGRFTDQASDGSIGRTINPSYLNCTAAGCTTALNSTFTMPGTGSVSLNLINSTPATLSTQNLSPSMSWDSYGWGNTGSTLDIWTLGSGHNAGLNAGSFLSYSFNSGAGYTGSASVYYAQNFNIFANISSLTASSATGSFSLGNCALNAAAWIRLLVGCNTDAQPDIIDVKTGSGYFAGYQAGISGVGNAYILLNNCNGSSSPCPGGTTAQNGVPSNTFGISTGNSIPISINAGSQATPQVTVTTGAVTTNSKLVTAAAVSGGAGFNLPPGSTPSSPSNGDLWTTAGGLYAQIAGATVGPFGTGSGGMVWPSVVGIPYWTTGTAWGGAYNAGTTIPNNYLGVLTAGSNGLGTFATQNYATPPAIGGTTPAAGSFTTVNASGQITSTVVTGTAPFVVSSTSTVANLSAASLNGASFAAPGPIGSTTPSTLSASSIQDTAISVAGIVNTTNTGVIGSEAQVTAAHGGTGVNNTATLTLGTANRNYATLGTGFEYNTTTTGAVTTATAANLGSLLNIAQYAVHVSGGTAAAVIGVSPGTSGYPLISQGASANPAFAQLPAAAIATGALASGMTATTQSAGDNTTDLATDAFVQTAASGCQSSCNYLLGLEPIASLTPVAGTALLASYELSVYKFYNQAATKLGNVCLKIQVTNAGNAVVGVYNGSGTLVWNTGSFSMASSTSPLCFTPTATTLAANTSYYLVWSADNTSGSLTAVVASGSAALIMGSGPAHTVGFDTTDVSGTSGAPVLPSTITLSNITNYASGNYSIPYVYASN